MQIKDAGLKLTFAVQAEEYLCNAGTRQRDPLRPQTVSMYRGDVQNHLNPILGKLSLESIGNKALKELISKLVKKGLKPATIERISNVFKKIVASAVNDEGDQLYPRVWKAEFTDQPKVKADEQKAPTISPETLQEAIRQAISGGRPHCAAFYALLAGSGLRVAEAMAVQVDSSGTEKCTVWSPLQSKIIVRQQRIDGHFAPPKTKAGIREVDIAPELNDFLLAMTRLMPDGVFAFPESESYYRMFLSQDGINGGFHTMRRFRVRHLEESGVPPMLTKFWTGHAAAGTTERYIKFGPEVEARKQYAKNIGLGFILETKAHSEAA